jgi:hypothetical protein
MITASSSGAATIVPFSAPAPLRAPEGAANAAPARDREQTRRFLRLLDPTARAFTFQTFDDDRSNGHARNEALTLATSDREQVLQIYAHGGGVFVTTNETDLAGRKSGNIIRVRAIWQEDDGGHGGPFPLDPSLVVESSPGHFHRYWLIADHWPADEQGRADFARVMERMVSSYGSDKNAKDISRVLRLPGFLHRKNPAQPFMARFVAESGRRYTREQIMRAFPPVERETRQHDYRPDRPEWRAGDGDEDRIADALHHVPADDRDVRIQVGMALKAELGESGRPLWDGWLASCPGLNERNRDRTWRSFRRNGIGIATLFWHAQQRGWSPPRSRGNGAGEWKTEKVHPGDTKTESDGDVSLPDGIIFDGSAAPAPRPKLIEGLLCTTGLVFLGGQGSAGKSFIAVGMAVALATGEPFFGRAVNERVGTLIIAAEGREDMQARIAAAKKQIHIEEDLPILWMAVPDFGDAFLKDLDRINTWMKVKHDVRLGMIVIDTVSASFALKEEDDNAEAARVCRLLRRLGDHINGVMVPVHHYGKDPSRGLRGASAWTFNTDMALAVNAEIAPDGAVSGRSLAVMKDRGGIQGPVSAFDLVSVELVTEDGTIFTNLAVAPTEVAPTAAVSQWDTNALRNLKRALEEVLPAYGRDEYPYPDGPMCRVVDSDVLRPEFAKITVVDSDTPEKMADAHRKAYTRGLKAAQDRGLIGVKNRGDGGQVVWLAKPMVAVS